MTQAFTENNQKVKGELKRVLAAKSIDDYKSFLATGKKANLSGCGFDTVVLKPKLEAYRLAKDYAQIEKLLGEVWVLFKLKRTSEEKLFECVERLTVAVDEHGLFRSGLLYKKSDAGQKDFSFTRSAEGWVMLINPQLMYAWPGKKSSALACLLSAYQSANLFCMQL